VTSPPGFEEYVTARRDQLVRTAYLLTGDLHQAEDLVQIALIRIWPRWTRVSGVQDVDAYAQRTLFTVFVKSQSARALKRLRGTPAIADVPAERTGRR